MLRWCQSTVHRALDGKASTTIPTTRLFSAGHPSKAPVAATTTGGRSCLTRGLLKQSTNRPTTLYSTNTPTNVQVVVAPSHETLPSPEITLQGQDDIQPSEHDTMLDLDDALATLQHVLSDSTRTSAKTSIDTIIECYKQVKSSRALKKLSSKQLTELMSLLGTLSIPLPRNRCIYSSKLLSHVDVEEDEGQHWELVLELSRIKEKVLGVQLSGTDRFWVMRGLLAQVVISSTETLELGHPHWSVLDQATSQYQRIWKHTPDPEVHVPYFEALFSTKSDKGLSMLVPRLCRVLELHKNPHTRIQDILWRVVLERVHDLTSEQQDRILAMVFARLDSTTQQAELGDRVSGSQNDVLSIDDLSSALGNVLFPSYSPTKTSTPEIQQWAKRRAMITFGPSTPHSVRIAQLIPLVLCKLPKTRLHSINCAHDIKLSNALEWRTILLLSFLQTVLNGDPLSPKAKADLQEIVDSLWESWQSIDHPASDRPTNVTRTVVSAFLHVASQTGTVAVVRGATQFSKEFGLLRVGEATTLVDRLQALDLRITNAVAVAACRERSIGNALASIQQPLSGNPDLLRPLFRHYAHRNPMLAYVLYQRGQKYNNLESETTHLLAMSTGLIARHQMAQAACFLRHPHFSPSQTERLIGAFLESFRQERRGQLDEPMAKALCEAMLKLYEDKMPSSKFKWQIRYFMQIAILSTDPSLAFKLINAVEQRRPEFFGARLFMRLVRAFVQRRSTKLARRLSLLVPFDNTSVSRDFHRKALLLITKTGAWSQAHRLYRIGVRRAGYRTGRELMARAVRFRPGKPSFIRSLAVSSILKGHLSHAASLKFGFDILMRSGRFKAARRILDAVHNDIDVKLKTALCNAYLHGCLIQHVFRNGRLVRQVVRVKDQLERQYGFKPDRITMNIVIKSMLRWRQIVTSQKMKELFDHMVRSGYPAPPELRRFNGVPFGTRATGQVTRIPTLEAPISFERHVQPLYRMFIKAFYVRGDRNAAQLVVKILHEEEESWRRGKDLINYARNRGIELKKNKSSTF